MKKPERFFSFAGAFTLLSALAACSTGNRDPHCPALIGGGNYCLQQSTAVAPFEVQQKVEVRFNGQRETMIVELETDASGIRLVGMTPLGQTLLRVSYDNLTTKATKLPNSRLPPELLVALLQLALWPYDALQAGLENSLRLEESAGQRRILNNGRVTLTINYAGDQPPYQRMKMHILAEDIEVDIETLDPIQGAILLEKP